jgi:hypothetical protein
MDTVTNINIPMNKALRNNEVNVHNHHMNTLKEKLGDLIDSSGGTIDDIEVFQNENVQNMEPASEIHINQLNKHLSTKNFKFENNYNVKTLDIFKRCLSFL